MAFEVPKDLIRQAQIGFREHSGLSSFDPKDPILPSLPSVEASIAGLDPSPPYLRCKHCKGKLLRGIESMICIYCGKYQKKDLPPEPISFKSTAGYRWLLQSLKLNGSERVETLAEGTGRNRGQSPAEDETTLSQLLDLRIIWRDEPQKPETSVDNRIPEHGSSSSNFSKVDLDNFFTGSQRDIASDASEEQSFVSKNDQSKVFLGQENLSLFQNVLPPDTAITSSNDAIADASSSGWDAEFQSASSKLQTDNSESVDPFVGSGVDLSAHKDSVFGRIENLKNREQNNGSEPLPLTGNNWIGDDLFSNMNSAVHQQVGQLDSVDDEDWFEDATWHKSSINNTAVSQQADQFDSDVKANNVLSPVNLNKGFSEGVNRDWFEDTNWQKSSANNTAVSQQAEQFDLVVKAKDGSSEAVGVDWFENTNWQKSTASNTTITKDDDPFDIRPKVDAISPSSMSQNPDIFDFSNSKEQSSDTTDWFQGGQWQIDASSAANRVANNYDDSFDEWNDFTSSTVNQDSLQNSFKQSSTEDAAASKTMSESGPFQSSRHPEEVDFGTFSQADLFSGSSTKYNPSDNQDFSNILSEASTASRSADAKAGNNAEQPENEEIAPNATTSSKNDAEMLLSQMHDLSFMLETKLSIPSKKPDGVGSSSHD